MLKLFLLIYINICIARLNLYSFEVLLIMAFRKCTTFDLYALMYIFYLITIYADNLKNAEAYQDTLRAIKYHFHMESYQYYQ